MRLHRWAALAGAALLALGAAAAHAAPDLAKTHADAKVACAKCHGQAKPAKAPAKPNASCVTCHGPQPALAGKTAAAKPNPHAPPHLAAGETQACNECHHIHKPSEVACAECHRGFRFNVK